MNGQPLTKERFEAFLNDIRNAKAEFAGCTKHVVSPRAMREKHNTAWCFNCGQLVDLRDKWIDMPPLPPVVDLDPYASTQETS